MSTAIRRGRSEARPPWKAWQAQLLIVAGLALAFAIPYFIASAMAARRDSQWMKSGLSVYEIGEWRENGFADVGEAVRWRTERFKAPGALLWKEEGFDAAAARGWNDASFGPREATRWREQGFAAWESAPWRDAGFLPQDARSWKNAGVSPSDAAARRKKGEDPG